MLKEKNILLVEDEVIIAMAQKKNLEDSGFDVTLAHSGEKAVEVFESTGDIDLVLMDIDLGKPGEKQF